MDLREDEKKKKEELLLISHGNGFFLDKAG